MVDCAQAEAVAYDRQALLLEVADDVGGVEEAGLLESADCALVCIGRQHARAEARLVQAHARFANGVAALNRTVRKEGLALVVGRLVRGVDAQRRGAALRRGLVDPFLEVQKRNPPPTESEPLIERALVRQLRPVLRTQHIEGRET